MCKLIWINYTLDVTRSQTTPEQRLLVAYDIGPALVLIRKWRLYLMILLLLFVFRNLFAVNVKLSTFTLLTHWLCTLFEKEEHLSF